MAKRAAVAALLLALLGVAACGDDEPAPPPSDIVGVYRLDPLTIPGGSAAPPSHDSEDLISTLGTVLRDSELSIRADGTYEWKSFFLSDQAGGWTRVGDVVTIQPTDESGVLPTSLSFRLGAGTLTLTPAHAPGPALSPIVFRRQ